MTIKYVVYLFIFNKIARYIKLLNFENEFILLNNLETYKNVYSKF